MLNNGIMVPMNGTSLTEEQRQLAIDIGIDAEVIVEDEDGSYRLLVEEDDVRDRIEPFLPKAPEEDDLDYEADDIATLRQTIGEPFGSPDNLEGYIAGAIITLTKEK